MFVSTILVVCYYNRNILRIERNVKYVGNKAIIVPFDVPVDCTFEQLGDIVVPLPLPRRRVGTRHGIEIL